MSFFIVFLLLTKKNKAVTDKILAVWVAVMGIHLLGYYYNIIGYWEKYPHFIGVTAPVPLFHGPLLYLYCLYALRDERKIRRVDYLHFIPGMAAYLYMWNFFFYYTAEEKVWVDKGEINDFSTFSILLLVAILTSGLAYTILAFRLTMQHKLKIKQSFSYSEGISLQWLRNCIFGIGLVFLAAIIVFLSRGWLNISFTFDPELIFYAILIIFIFYIGYFGIRHEHIFVGNGLHDKQQKKKIAPEIKYKNSGMNEAMVHWIYQKLLSCMEEEKPYLSPKLTLAELAARLNVSVNQLSQVINQQAGVNFHDFVNSYRIDAFLKSAKENKNYSLLALALDAGFNSKSSFNYIFKKQKGFTPSQYLLKKM